MKDQLIAPPSYRANAVGLIPCDSTDSFRVFQRPRTVPRRGPQAE